MRPLQTILAGATLALAACAPAQLPTAQAAGLPSTSLYQLDSRFTDATGAARTLTDFAGRPIVVAMVFTHCSYACPRILADLKGIEARLVERVGSQSAASVEIVLVSMDSERDTPEVLADYAEREGIGRPGWTLMHGDAYAVRGLAGVLGVRYKQGPSGDFAHSNLLTVLDREGRQVAQLSGLGADPTPALAALEGLLR